VAAIPRGTPVRATWLYGVEGRLEDVTSSTLTILRLYDGRRVTMDRSLLVSLAVLQRKKMRWGWLGRPLAVGAVGGLLGTLVGVAMRDAGVAGVSLALFAASGIGWFYHFMYHYADQEWHVVYVRP
jgi:hypothetical protein